MYRLWCLEEEEDLQEEEDPPEDIDMKINFENGVFFKVTYLILLAYALGKEALLGFGV